VDDVLVVVAKHHNRENGNPHDERGKRHGPSRTPHSLPYLPITEKLWQSTPVSLAGQTTSSPARKRPLPPLFAERAGAAQLLTALVVPAVFGSIVGVMLGVSAPVYWGLQIVAAIGGLLIDGPGFWALGTFCFVAAVLAAVVVWIFVREEPIDLEIAPAI